MKTTGPVNAPKKDLLIFAADLERVAKKLEDGGENAALARQLRNAAKRWKAMAGRK